MVASIGVIASPSQGVSYYERDGYYTKDDPAHREASGWAGRGAEDLGLSGPVDSDAFKAVLEGKVPDGPHLGKRDKDGEIHHRPGRDVTLSAPKSVSLMALVGGDQRVVAAHDRAVTRTLSWIERNAVETRIQDKASGAMVHAGGQKMVAATFRHDTSRNLDPQLHAHAVVANMVQGDDVFSQTGSTLIVRAAGPGTATVTVTATDPDGLSATQSFTVTVFPADHPDTDAGASEIIAGQTVEGYINSPDDVDYFLFRVSEPGVYEIMLESKLPGLEISLRDENGHTLAVDRTESLATIVVALPVAVLQIVIRCQISPICVAVVNEALTAALAPGQSNPLTVLKFVVAVAKRLTEEPELRSDAPLVGVCRCLAIVEPEGAIEEIDLNDYFEGQTGGALNFSVRGQIPESLTVNLDGATGRLAISAPRGADLGIHRFLLEVGEEDNPETSAVFTAKVNVSALPRLLPGQSLTVNAEPGKTTSIDLTDVIGAPENVGQHRPLSFALDLTEAVSSLLARLESPYLVIEPPSDLEGEFALSVSAWFPDGPERSKDFTFQVIVGEQLGRGWVRAQNIDCHVNVDYPGRLYFRFWISLRAGTYSGECRARKTHGEGTWIQHGVLGSQRYEGGWQNGRRHGQGTWTWVDHPDPPQAYPDTGRRSYGGYEGQWQENKPHGRGIYWSYGFGSERLNRHEGQWQDGKPHGQGTLLAGRGTGRVNSRDIDTRHWYYRYKGEWRRNSVEGQEYGRVAGAVFWNGSVTSYARFNDIDITFQVRNGRRVE